MRLEPATGGSGGQLGPLFDAVDDVVARYGGERFYAERLAHFSVAWSLAPLAAAWASRGLAGQVLRCDRAVCRVGERLTEVRLA